MDDGAGNQLLVDDPAPIDDRALANGQASAEPFAAFTASLVDQSDMRAAITAQTRAPEAERVAALVVAATLPAEVLRQARATAITLVQALREKGTRGVVQGLMREYDLSSQEGIALMCLAEALLRVPDQATRDALIRDKIGAGDWRAHIGRSPSPFVNAATWGLVVTGKLVGPVDETGLAAALNRLLARGGEPVVRRGVDMAMRMMGEQFVSGQTIDEALRAARRLEARGYRYSYDMLGEAAVTAADAGRYFADYERAIHAIGRAAAGRGVVAGPGISVKLSALHPRYARSQRERVMSELLPRLSALAALARDYDIGLNIDAEESERLDLSLDLLEALCLDPALDGWQGIGFVIQAYGKRAPFVLDWVIDLARRSRHRLMVRLVKGAYWDSEIKRAQQEGLADFPVFTRKAHTDVSYIACARKLLDAPDAVFPQFATHNAYTVAVIHAMAGPDAEPDAYEFQCLHGMGEPLYDEVVGRLGQTVRIYAPVGVHETLLAYLVRRLLENGANSSFVNRIQDPAISVEDLAADPVAQVAALRPVGARHDRIRLPAELFAPARANAAGCDFNDEGSLHALAAPLMASAAHPWTAAPTGDGITPARDIRNPADHRDLVGHMVEATPAEVDAALAAASSHHWRRVPAHERAMILLRAADLIEARMPALLGLLVREAGKSLPNAVGEVREAVDFLRFYAAQVRDGFDDATHEPLGAVACISPWNFPLAIFTGQVAAALAAGNTVLAKPAEETPLIAARAVAILHEAGVPAAALQLLPGGVGARLVADPRTRGVLFTGSGDVARLIGRELAKRLSSDGSPVPLIAETGGQNAMVVDSSALAEQVVADVLTSAFDSAGQRCSALRLLCLQDDVAERTLTMLKGALAELSVGNPDRLSVDVGPVISAEARDGILVHVEAMRARGLDVHQASLPAGCAHGTFVPPTIIALDDLSSLKCEVLGPVLHVLRFPRDGLDALIASINSTGYGLTFGVHSRIAGTIARLTAIAGAGNIYVNRNMVGAVVGVQPFGGHGLSGTGPKAGGPLTLRRLLARRPATDDLAAGREVALPGPVGEENLYRLEPRGTILCSATSRTALLAQVEAVLATGNRPLVTATWLGDLPPALAAAVVTPSDQREESFDAVLFQGSREALMALAGELAARPGPLVQIHVADIEGRYPMEWLMRERSISVNTTAAGGNANLMMLG